jgi:hypothetical protein
MEIVGHWSHNILKDVPTILLKTIGIQQSKEKWDRIKSIYLNKDYNNQI